MNNAALESLGSGQFRLSGDLDFETVPALLAQGTAMFAERVSAIKVDLSGVKRTNSVGIALMIEWLRRARGVQSTIEFHNVPPQMLAMAKLSGLDTMLPLAASGTTAPGATT